MGDNTNLARSPLLPLRHEQDDLFVCDIFDAVPKGDAASMEHPVFSLATKPDTKIRTYESADGKSFVKVTPSVEGLATVFDRDILIYCISQVMAGLNRGRKVSKTLQIRAHDMQLATNRGTDGRGYEQLRAALERLKGTTISTNITTGGEEQFDTFGLIDKASVKRKTRDGRMQEIEITLSDWVFNAIRGEEVLTLNRQYFQLRKPLERRLYELARKHCGQQRSWQIGLEKLHAKTGSSSTPKEFKRMVSAIIEADREHNHMPDYGFELEGGIVTVRPKAAFTEAYADPKGAFCRTPFEMILQEHGLTQLVIAGVTTEVCVQTTMREANDRGYNCLLATDATESYFPEFKAAKIEMFIAQGGIVGWATATDEILEALDA